LSASMRWSKVSEKYWNSAFCLCTSSPRMRFRNLAMEQSGGRRGHVRLWCPAAPPLLPRDVDVGTHPSPHPGSLTETHVHRCQPTAGPASCLWEGAFHTDSQTPRRLPQSSRRFRAPSPAPCSAWHQKHP
jgi:hypothetical protein